MQKAAFVLQVFLMRTSGRRTARLSTILATAILGCAMAGEPSADQKPAAGIPPQTLEEARERARLLHESFHGALQVVHRDFFDPDDRDRIPSATLEDVFEVLASRFGVQLHWLGVNARTMDVEHHPQDQFEQEAVAALADGKKEYEKVENGHYRYAGAIQLHNQCLKCHVPQRTSLEDRTAGLAISMRFGKE